MSLRTKLFYSHVAVVLASIVAVVVISGLVSSLVYQEITEETTTDGAITRTVDEDVSGSALTRSLLAGFAIAGAISTGIAFALSLTLSRRMTGPVRAMIRATERIAEGRYDQRVTYRDRDEIGELAGHFNHMAESLDNIETTRRQLLADLTHELNTPLTSIIGAIEGLQDGTITTVAASHSAIHDEALRLQRLVRDVQVLSAMEADGLTLRMEALNACDLLQAAADRLRIQYEGKGVRLDVAATDDALSVRGDRDRLIQVLINLLGNALQYTPEGGGVTVSAAVDGNVVFTIADTGIGIAAADLKAIFDRFYRVEKSRNRRTGGSGIGLTIARTIVEAHGGRIWAESEGPGRGSTFRFSLPRG